MRRRFRGCAWSPLVGMDILMPAVLVALLQQPGYGYILLERVRALGVEIPGYHLSVLYRILRMMEMEGLVASSWDTEGPGPARRVYAITNLGRAFLRDWSQKARENLKMVERLIQIIEKGGD